MTKKEWSNLIVGQRVKKDSWTIDRSIDPPCTKPITYYGSVYKMNSNHSQALIKYDNGTDNWEGRLGIEVI